MRKTQSGRGRRSPNCSDNNWTNRVHLFLILNVSVNRSPGHWLYLGSLVGVWCRWFTPVQSQDLLHWQAILKQGNVQRLKNQQFNHQIPSATVVTFTSGGLWGFWNEEGKWSKSLLLRLCYLGGMIREAARSFSGEGFSIWVRVVIITEDEEVPCFLGLHSPLLSISTSSTFSCFFFTDTIWSFSPTETQSRCIHTAFMS